MRVLIILVIQTLLAMSIVQAQTKDSETNQKVKKNPLPTHLNRYIFVPNVPTTRPSVDTRSNVPATIFMLNPQTLVPFHGGSATVAPSTESDPNNTRQPGSSSAPTWSRFLTPQWAATLYGSGSGTRCFKACMDRNEGEIPNESERTHTCRNACETDADGDGALAISVGGNDCDDNDPDRFPGNVEVCDELHKDEDCDPTTVGDRDQDKDGFIDASCGNWNAGELNTGNDCDDLKAHVHPLAPEACDGLDNNCNGIPDDGVTVDAYEDKDGDQFGDFGANPLSMCLKDLHQAGPPSLHFSLYNTDCDDNDPRKHPAAPEVRDNLDNDCNGVVDDIQRN